MPIEQHKGTVIILNGWTKGDISNIPAYLPTSTENWMGWTKAELEKLGYSVEAPFLKDAYKQEYQDWRDQLSSIKVDEQTTLIGWSAGGAYWVRWLGETGRRAKKLILVAPAKLYKRGKTESNFDRFMNFTIDPAVKDHVKQIVIFLSDDTDDLIASAKLYQKKLGAKLVYISNQGHFTNAQRPSPAFPELLTEIIQE